MDSVENDIKNLDVTLLIKKANGGPYSAIAERGLGSGTSDTAHKDPVDQKGIQKKKQRKRRKGKKGNVETEDIKKANNDTPCVTQGDGNNEDCSPRVATVCETKVQLSSELTGRHPKGANDKDIYERAQRVNVERTIFNPGNLLKTVRSEKSESCDTMTTETSDLNDLTCDVMDHDDVCSSKRAFALFELAPQDVIVMEIQNGEQKTLDPSEVVFVLSETDDIDEAERKSDGDIIVRNSNAKDLLSTYFTANKEDVGVLCDTNDKKCEDTYGDEGAKCEKPAEFEQAPPELSEMCATGAIIVVEGRNDVASLIQDDKETDSVGASTKFADKKMDKYDTKSSRELDAIINKILCFELSVLELKLSLAEDYIDDSSGEVTVESIGVGGIGNIEDIEDSLKKSVEISVKTIEYKDKIKDLKWNAHKVPCEALKTVLDAEDSVVNEFESDYFQECGLESRNIEVIASNEEDSQQNEMLKGPVLRQEVTFSEYYCNSREISFPHINSDLVAEESNEKYLPFQNGKEDCKPGKFKSVISSERIGCVENVNKSNTEMENKCEDSCQNDAFKEILGPTETSACMVKNLREFYDNFAIVKGHCEGENINSVKTPFSTAANVTKSLDSKRKQHEDENDHKQYNDAALNSMESVVIEKKEFTPKIMNTNPTKNFQEENPSGTHLQKSIFAPLQNAGLGCKDEEGILKSTSESDLDIFEEAFQDTAFLVKDSDKVTVEPRKIADKMDLVKDASLFGGEVTSQELPEEKLEVVENTDDKWTDTEEEVDGYSVYLQDSGVEYNVTSQLTPVETNLLYRVKILEDKNSQLSARNKQLILENYELRVLATQTELRLQIEMDRRRFSDKSRGVGVVSKGFNCPQCTLM